MRSLGRIERVLVAAYLRCAPAIDAFAIFLRFRACKVKSGTARIGRLRALVLAIGSQSVALLQQLALGGLFKDVTQVVELGAQESGQCSVAELEALHMALGREPPESRDCRRSPAADSRDLFQSLGLSCTSIEFEASAGGEADRDNPSGSI